MLLCDFQNYAIAIPILKAQEYLEEINVVSYPHAKDDYKKKLHRDLHRVANPETWSESKKPLTLEQLAGMIARG